MSGVPRPIKKQIRVVVDQSQNACSAARDDFAGFPSMLLIEAGISSIWRREVFSFERVVHGMAVELALLPFSEQWL